MADAKVKIIRKKWLPMKASKFFDSEPLGECYVTDAQQLLGRTVTANLANLTGDIRQQSVTLKFIVNSLDGEVGVADVIGYEMAPPAVRRIVRRGSDRLDESFICEASDGQKVRIKPMIITKTVTNSAVHSALRNALAGIVVKLVKQHTFESLINEIITSKLQMAVKTELKKIYPLKAVEVRYLWLLSGERAAGKDIPLEAEPESGAPAKAQEEEQVEQAVEAPAQEAA